MQSVKTETSSRETEAKQIGKRVPKKIMNFTYPEDVEFSSFRGAQECDQASSFGGDFVSFGHSCFTHYGYPSEMSDRMGRGRGHQTGGVTSSTSSRIPRCASSPRQMSHSPKPNYSFRPLFHERTTTEDNSVLTQELWKLARKSGTLNLSNKALARAVVTQEQLRRWKSKVPRRSSPKGLVSWSPGFVDSSALWFQFM
ncbi:hypothetical protein M5D96_000659 [Drosophila gunungcola]|uniref:Uncharacterized protein n=1 Tax=Drosophila gunungcola TaxID=103775 RepID=A0A9P9YX14_9MUSC|nr:hypothetical protein M5D96_000659 [Drosophila gunungcola]